MVLGSAGSTSSVGLSEEYFPVQGVSRIVRVVEPLTRAAAQARRLSFFVRRLREVSLRDG